MRFITRDDASLSVALVAASVILFRQPLRDGLDFVQAVEARYRLDLMPALLLLIIVFAFHQYRKRTEVRAALAASALDAAHVRRHSVTLQYLVDLSQGLGHVQDREALQQTLWRHLPALTGNREFWVLLNRAEWELVVHETRNPRPLDVLATIAERAVRRSEGAERVEGAADPEGAAAAAPEEDQCFPMIVNGAAVGVLAVRGDLGPDQRSVMCAAAATIAIAVKNMQVLLDTRELSVRDELTGCVTRAAGLETVSLELRRARRTHVPVSLLMFDVDNFKAINDEFGHLGGDEVLRAVGAQLRRMLRSTDIRCRYGGDEFLIILPDTPAAGAGHVAEWVRREVANLKIHSGGTVLTTTVSIGVAAVGAEATDCTALIGRADAALYEAKRSGRNRVVVAATPGGREDAEMVAVRKAG